MTTQYTPVIHSGGGTGDGTGGSPEPESQIRENNDSREFFRLASIYNAKYNQPFIIDFSSCTYPKHSLDNSNKSKSDNSNKSKSDNFKFILIQNESKNHEIQNTNESSLGDNSSESNSKSNLDNR